MLVSAKLLRKEVIPASEYDEQQWADTSPLSGVATTSPEEVALITSITAGNIVGDDLNRKKRLDAISTKGFEPTDFAYERSIGRNDSLYSNFTELIALAKRKVGRIATIEDGERVYATGFMVSSRLLLTNWHVFKRREMADEGEVYFFYEYDAQGRPLDPVIFKFDTAAGFFNNKALDYCFVAVQPMDVTGEIPLENIGYLYLDKMVGKLGDTHVEKLNLIHHPLGDYKQISIRENTFEAIKSTRIFYTTDTAPGSSGSPVFNDQWQVVGLHHKGVAKMSADGKAFLDKDDQPIPIVEGKIDASRVVWVKNEGIRISVILSHLSKKHPNNDLIATLAVPPPPENLYFMTNASVPAPKETNINPALEDSGKNINIHVPVSALSADHSIEISLSSKSLHPTGSAETRLSPIERADELFLETAKVDKEQAMDFSQCKGYQPDFLEVVEIPLPQPKATIKKQVARLKNNRIELKYFKHSVIFNAVTRMPLISAVNVEGDATQRLDDSKRSDDWLRDKRIDLECQLTDKFYAKSNFDKGHMSRFEDANWDNTEEDALRNGIYTCLYTNACPQVPGLNRAGGLWGKLEKAILEKGIKKEEGKQAKMIVFNGPIFNENKDRIFKGVRIPMEYYKIIVWLSDDNKPKATAFKLSQETQVGDVEFDESMRLGEEALDIDKVVEFKNCQCSIKSLGDLTNIDFKHLEQYDTFVTNNGGEENFIDDIESIVL